MTGEAHSLANPNEPLGRVILVPLDGISVVHWELMVEIVIPFTDGDESSYGMVARSMLVVKRSLPEPVSE